MTIEEYRQLAKNSPQLYWLSLTGGEPTENDNIVLIVDSFLRSCPKLTMLNMTTNGIDSDKIVSIVQKIAGFEIPYFAVTVSIDGPPPVHDSLRGVPGNFSLAVQTLKAIKKIPNVRLKAGMTLFPENMKTVKETLEAIQEQVPWFKLSDLHLNIPHSSEHFYANRSQQLLRPTNLNQVIEKYRRATTRGWKGINIVQAIYLRLALRFLASGISPLPCVALKHSVYISEHGDIYPCTIWNNKIASLRKKFFDFMSISKERSFKENREKISRKQCPQCWTPCEGYQSILTNVAHII